MCVAGERACPPEDVGGAFGYAEFLAALEDPAHPRHEPMRSLVGGAFDPGVYEPDRATTLLRRLA